MRRDDLDVLDGPASVAAVVLETGVRELDVSILVRQLVLLGPSGHCIGPLLRRLAPFSARSVFRLEEPLILPLQFFLENHTADSTLGPSLTEARRVDLSQSPTLRLVDPAAVADALRRMERPPVVTLTTRILP